MKALNDIALQSILDSDLVWRRKEVSSLITLAKSATLPNQNAVIRASVPLLYAHWEGFGRECFTRYLEFVSYKRTKFDKLSPSFFYLASLPSLSGISEKPISEGIGLIQQLMSRHQSVNKDTFRKQISTKSNLRFNVLSDLLVLCGLPNDAFGNYKDFINKELCDSRNEIAHGSGAAPSLPTLLLRRDKAFEIMELLQGTVVHAANAETFKVSRL